MRPHLIASLLLAAPLTLLAQEPIAVGSGSYASFPPTAVGRTDAHGGDQSTAMQTRRLWVTERPDQPIPTNDWWTGLINARFADALWSYPAMVHPSETGVTVAYPTHWNANGTELIHDTHIEVQARRTDAPRGATDRFVADAAIAHTWHDWDVEMLLPDKLGTSQMLVTLVHGQPFTWIELTGALAPRILLSQKPTAFETFGNSLYFTLGADCYGIYLPKDAKASLDGTTIDITLSAGTSQAFAVVALLPEPSALEQFTEFAYNIPRDTRVDWDYNTSSSTVSSCWTVATENLLTGVSGGPVLQGFLPHQYKGATVAPTMTADTYLTPRGTMKMATGNSFTFAHTFSGMLPWWPAPIADNSVSHPYRPEVMNNLISRYAMQGTMGDDTYWGGKGLIQMAQNMTFALETGDLENFEIARNKLRTKLIDWLTYTPGETRVFFARYPRWGGLVGEASSYDSDTFNDHHFHYGYFTLAGAMLCLVDDDFCRRYGPMLREVAKDYANWDRTDTRYPFLRTLDPWVGHSYAGGLGDQGNSNGNGQESSSESMQGWGGVYLLGVALGDEQMRNTGIFGWLTEAKATREYWFDVDARFDRYGQGGNYDHSLFTQPYNTNITCKGIGWWTWFSGDPLHMHGIQWLPVSPALDYLSWDRDFVAWAYNDLMNTPGWGHHWFEDGTDPAGNRIGMLANDDWGNVALAYMQRAFPDKAAEIFDTAYGRNLGIATAISTGHISYYLIHAHRTYGDIDFGVHADIPTAQMMVHPSTGRATYVVYNPGQERNVTFYRGSTPLRTLRAPHGKMIAVADESHPTAIEISSESGLRTLNTLQLSAKVVDQYGASMPDKAVTWSCNMGTVSQNGLLNVSKLAECTAVKVTATCGNLSAEVNVTVSAPSAAAHITILPEIDFVEKGAVATFRASVLDQYGEPMDNDISWSIDGVGVQYPTVDTSSAGNHTITASTADLTASRTLFVTPSLPDLALNRQSASSSEENAGSLTSGAFDGNGSTRWGSAHTDDQWIAVDLGSDCRLTSVLLDWEAAYAADYVIETAPASVALTAHTGPGNLKRIPAEWDEAARVTGQQHAGKVSVALDASARYVRMRTLRRGSAYGVSLYSMEVHGIPEGTGSDYCLGLDIVAPTTIIDENSTLQLAATAWHADGSSRSVDNPQWSAQNGTITASGLYTPTTYGTDIVTVKAINRSAEAEITAREVARLSSISVAPLTSWNAIVGEPIGYDVTALNQFGGECDLGKSLTVSCSNTAAMSADVAHSTLTFLAPGTYTVTFSAAGVTTSTTVTALLLSDYNLAPAAFATAPSGDNPHLAADGDLTTRWQAKPNTEQSITFELDDLYAVNRVATVWEAALATQWHIEASTDGHSWYEIAKNTTPPTAGTRVRVEFNPVPARMIKIVGDKLSDAALTYGMSLFEVEIYAESRIGSDSDNQAPIITHFSAIGGEGTIDISASATDNSGYVTLKFEAKPTGGDAPQGSATALIHSGEKVNVVIDGLRQALYECTLTASDASGNSSVLSIYVQVVDPSLDGVNLALGKPAKASSAESDGLAARFAVDGNDNSRWGSTFHDNEWLEVDLGDRYSISSIEILVLDAAYATEALIETSTDGTTWKELTTLSRTSTGLRTVTLSQPVTARYLRYTGLKRATGYGVSINELRVYGNYAASGIETVNADAVTTFTAWPTDGLSSAAEIYTIDGRRASTSNGNLAPGIYITPEGKKAIKGAIKD